MLFCLIAMLALTRAEIVQRMRAPSVTQANGLIRVYASCPEDMRREFQGPVANCAAATVTLLCHGEKMKLGHYDRPHIIVTLGDVRTNVADVVARASTNDSEITTRIYLKSPGGADLERFRMEVTRAFYRAIRGREMSEDMALQVLHAADPVYQIASRRAKLESWLAGDRSQKGSAEDEVWDEEHLALMRKVVEVGVSSRRDVRTFASRLYLYPPLFNEPFAGGRRLLSFREAIESADADARIRSLALRKATEIAIFGSGRSEELGSAAEAYVEFLKGLAAGEKDVHELSDMLLNADKRLELAWEKAK